MKQNRSHHILIDVIQWKTSLNIHSMPKIRAKFNLKVIRLFCSKNPVIRHKFSFWISLHTSVYIQLNIVQKNKNFLKEYWILRNILLPFNRIRIWFSNILLPLKGSRIKPVKILQQQNFNRIFGWDRCPIFEGIPQ